MLLTDLFLNAVFLLTNECRTSTHVAVLNDMAEIFNFCAGQEWQCEEDPSKKNVSYTLCKSIMEDYLRAAS